MIDVNLVGNHGSETSDEISPDGKLSYLHPSAHAAIDLMDQATANHLEQYDASAGIASAK
jgi:hypothetical protein